MPGSTVNNNNIPPGVENPYGKYTELYYRHRFDKMYANPKNDYSVRGGSGNNEKPTTTKGGY